MSIAKSFETPSFHSPIVLPGDSKASVGKDQLIVFIWIYLFHSILAYFCGASDLRLYASMASFKYDYVIHN